MPRMRTSTQESDQRSIKFFRLILSHGDMFNFYQVNFLLMYNHKFSLTELEEIIPFERDTYIALLDHHIEEKKKKKQNQNIFG